MKRNWDTVRRILLAVEQLGDGADDGMALTDDELRLMQAMASYGLFQRSIIDDDKDLLGLSWKGHDLLSMIRNEETWALIKKRAEQIGMHLNEAGIKHIWQKMLEQAL